LDVVIDDFLDPFTLLSEYDGLADLAPTRVALVPTADVARERNLGRGTGVDYIAEGIDHFYGLLPMPVTLARAVGRCSTRPREDPRPRATGY
jgi:hypothetical protein